MRKLVVGAATAAFLGAAGPAAAGGMYEGEGSMKDPAPVAPIAIWSGLYIGGTVGFGTGDTSDRVHIEQSDVTDDVAEFVNGFAGTGFSEPEVTGFIENLLGNDYDMDGAVYGGFIGYNWQMNNAVFGIEDGLNGTDFDGDTKCIVIADCNRELDYYGRVIGRLGYAVNNFLFYGFGGVAWGDVKTRVSVGGVPLDDAIDAFDAEFGYVNSSVNGEETHVGWTAGAGLEFAFTERFVAGIEYAHVDLGSERSDIVTSTDAGMDNNFNINLSNKIDVTFDVIKVRASYKLWHRDREPLESYK